MFRACLCHAVFSVPCSFVVTCWEMADLLGLVCVMIFATFWYGVWGQVWYLLVLIPDISLLTNYVIIQVIHAEIANKFDTDHPSIIAIK